MRGFLPRVCARAVARRRLTCAHTQGHAWTETALSSLQEAIECHQTAALYSDEEIAEGAPEEMSADDNDAVVGGALQAVLAPSPHSPGHAQSDGGAQSSDGGGGAGVGGAAAGGGRLLQREDAFCWTDAEFDLAWAGVAATNEAHSSAAHVSAALPSGVQGGTAGSQHHVSGQQGPWRHSSPHRPHQLLLDDGAIELMVQNGLRDVDVDLEQEHGELYSDSEDGSDDDWHEADHQLSLIQLQLKVTHRHTHESVQHVLLCVRVQVSYGAARTCQLVHGAFASLQKRWLGDARVPSVKACSACCLGCACVAMRADCAAHCRTVPSCKF